MVRARLTPVLVGVRAISRTCAPNRRLGPVMVVCLALLACADALSAQVTYTVVADLGSIGGAAPLGGVIWGADDALYGTTAEGGTGNCGVVYRLDTSGLTLIHEFSQPDGCQPVGELALGPDGSFYGVTRLGGNADPEQSGGTIYKIAPDGTFTVLHRFAVPSDDDPEPWLVPSTPDAGLTLTPDGAFYGTTRSADIFTISPEGVFAIVHQFAAEGEPQDIAAALLFAADGYLYGTSLTTLSLRGSPGSIFRVNPAGGADVLYRFRDFGIPPPDISPYPEGASPYGELVAGPDGAFYGANSLRGPNVTDQGTIFRLQPDGTLTILYAFSEGADQSYPSGASPQGGMMLGSDGALYGTTSVGGANGNGTIFRIGPDGVFATLRSFAQDGFAPTKGRLLEVVPGVFYGTAPSASGGVIYELRVAGALVADNLSLSTDEDQPVDGLLTASGAGPSATFSLATNGSLGVATITDAAAGTFTYAPNPDANGTDTFTFLVTDGTRESNIATVTVVIAAVNDAPVALDSAATTVENTQVQGMLGASDPDSASLTFVVVTNPAKGTVQLTDASTGGFTYTPNDGATGADAFTFRVSDGTLASNIATVSLTIVSASPGSPRVRLLLPAGAVRVPIGARQIILWTHNLGAGSFVRLELSRDGGASWEVIAPAVRNVTGRLGTLHWRVTGPATTTAALRVTSLSTGVFDVSRRWFRIVTPAFPRPHHSAAEGGDRSPRAP